MNYIPEIHDYANTIINTTNSIRLALNNKGQNTSRSNL